MIRDVRESEENQVIKIQIDLDVYIYINYIIINI